MKPLKVAGIAVLVLLGCLDVAVRSVAAQTTNAEAPQAARPKVTGVTGDLEADGIIRVDIENFEEWAKSNDATKLVPYMNGVALRGNYPEGIHATQNHVRFHLHITPENRSAWVDLLGEPKRIRKPVSFSVGLEDHSQFDTVFDPSHQVELTIFSRWYGIIALVIVVVTLILLVYLSRNTNLIRQPGPKPPKGKLRPYNLGRTQMAFWFFLVYASYVVIWLITDDLDTITPSLLGLMGISAGTALSEAMIDSGKDAANVSQLQDLTAEKSSLEQSTTELQSQIDALNAKATMEPEDLTNRDNLNKQLLDNRTRLGQLNQQIEALTPSESSGISGGFLQDNLSDGSGYSFHRFQIFAWTIVLGVIFVSSVYNTLTMPEFSATLLGLMGISSGTYIGFKFPEQK